jgi:hypothetical protein
MPKQNNNTLTIIAAVSATVVGALILGAIASFQGHATQEDLDIVEVESKERDDELDAQQNELIKAWRDELLKQATFQADVRADLRYLKGAKQ